MNYLRTAILLAGLTALFMAVGYLIVDDRGCDQRNGCGARAKASGVFICADRLVDLLESRVAAIRTRQAASYSSVPAFVSGNLPG